jgi:taurine--2-oxoglutarate transaminase
MRRARPPFHLPLWYTAAAGTREATAANTVVRARGMSISFADGTSIEDWCGQYYVNNVGYGRADVVRAMTRQSLRLSWVSPSLFADVRLALTRDLRRVLPRHLTTPQYNTGGSDSCESALRAARIVTGRTRVMTLARAYHGDTMTVENLCPPIAPYGDHRPWVIQTPGPRDLWEKAGRDWSRASDLALERAEATLRRHGPKTFAAIVVEPVMWTTGAVPLKPRLARGLRALCDRHGIKLVADEVVTGFGRTGRWLGSESVGLVPDAVICAKGLTGGYAPLGAVVFERAWGNHLRRHGLNHGLTFGGHPIGCAAARATLQILERERLVARAAAMGRRLRLGLEALARLHPGRIADVRGAGLLLGLQLEPGRRARGRSLDASGRAEALIAAARRAGMHLLSADDGAAILFTPPFVVTARRIDRLLGVLDRALSVY